LQVSGAATFSTGINITGNGGAVNAANKLGIDQNLGAARFYSNGGDASTKGSFEFHTNSSNGSLDVIALGISSTGAATFSSSVTATQFRLSALNTAPANASATGTLGEIRIDADYIYVCTATNTWKRTAIATW
jgi:hypothetical protein